MPPTLLIANRGEIARRIIRTATRMGMRTVAVYSDADAALPYVREADTAVRLGPAPARDSYLSAERIVAAAKETGAELVHPGYGFLAEDPSLARAVAAAGITFVGPPAEVLALCGSKSEAKAVARRAGVPVLPGYDGTDQREAALADAARAIGYPVMLKPAAGGGGIGMQAVASASQLIAAIGRARRIARAAFGDGRLMLEKLVPSPRHLEVQILADGHERIRALGERDCSAQRRHQKVVEEAPAPTISARVRATIAEASVRLAREVGYVSAGTVEFLVAGDEAWFLEMNTRLQVEHPVTEEVLGLDLVEQQLRIALGERLELAKTQVRGHAIEARVYAEDPAAGFLPSTGTLLHVHWPDGVRVDAGYEEGSAVTDHYDPLLAKVIAHGDDRGRALDALADALERIEILGVRTNVSFLLRYLAHPDVRAGRVTTAFVERELGSLAPGDEAPPESYALGAAAVIDGRPRAARDPWTALGAWRAGSAPAGLVVLREAGGERAVSVSGDGPYEVDGSAVVRGVSEPHTWSVAGAPGAAAREGEVVWVGWRGATYVLRTDPRDHTVAEIAPTEIDAPMPGVVLSVHASAGQRMRRGDLVAVLEAMKMELRVEAPSDGVVTAVLARAGSRVVRGQRLAEFDPDEPASSDEPPSSEG